MVVIRDHLVDAPEMLGHVDGAVRDAGVVVHAVGGSRGVGQRPVLQELLRDRTQPVRRNDIPGSGVRAMWPPAVATAEYGS